MTDEQRRHWGHELKLLRWLMGGVGFLIVTAAATGWQASQWASDIRGEIGSQDTRITSLEDRYVRHRERMAAIEAVQQSDGQAIARIEERLASQGESIARIEASVSELVRYLRRMTGDEDE